MKLYIRIKDSQPFEHPITEENLKQIFPTIDVENLPSNICRFERKPAPQLGVHEKNQTVTYELIDGVYTDIFRCEQMTAEEINITEANHWHILQS